MELVNVLVQHDLLPDCVQRDTERHKERQTKTDQDRQTQRVEKETVMDLVNAATSPPPFSHARTRTPPHANGRPYFPIRTTQVLSLMLPCATQVLQAALQLAEKGFLHSRLGDIYAKLHRYPNALSEYHKALALNQNLIDAYPSLDSSPPIPTWLPIHPHLINYPASSSWPEPVRSYQECAKTGLERLEKLMKGVDPVRAKSMPILRGVWGSNVRCEGSRTTRERWWKRTGRTWTVSGRHPITAERFRCNGRGFP
eukprot:3888616-Rhodomonas_salina.1